MTNFDAQKLINVPPAIRWLAIGILAICLATSIFVALTYVGQESRSDWVLLAMSVAQIAVSGLVVALIAFYSERDYGAKVLKQKTQDFLENQVPSALALLKTPRGAPVLIKFDGFQDVFGARYRVQFDDASWPIWVGLNVDRLIVIYFVVGNQDDIQVQKEHFSFCFGGAQKVGFDYFAQAAERADEAIICHWVTGRDKEGIISRADKRLFWSQDLAMMTSSFLRTAQRHNYGAPVRALPEPL